MNAPADAPRALPSTTPDRSLLLFFALALAITWTLQLPALLAWLGLLAGPVEKHLGLGALGAIGPAVAAVVVTRRTGAPSVFRALRVTPPLGAGLYLLAFLIFPLAHVVGRAVHAAALAVSGGAGDPGPWLYLPTHPVQIAAMVVMPWAEEPGWRGFAMPRLLRQGHGVLGASLRVGAVWAVWHVIMFVVAGTAASVGHFVLLVVNVLAGSVIFGWLYRRTRGSLTAMVLAHAGAHLDNPTQALPGNVAPFLAYTAAIAALGAILVGLDRAASGPEPARLYAPTHER